MISTTVLHERGQITELNPLMRHFIEQGEWMFVLVKTLTLVAAWVVLVWYSRINKPFVRRWCIWGSSAYVSIWTLWVLTSIT